MSATHLIKDYIAREFNLRERMLTVEFGGTEPSLCPPPQSFLPCRLELTERLSTPFRAVLYGVTPQIWSYPEDTAQDERDVEPGPDHFLGLMTAITVRAESRVRRLHGVVTGARHLGQWYSDTEGAGYDIFELVVEPSLRLLDLRHANRLYQERTTLQILHELLDEHRLFNPVVSAGLRATFPLQRHTDRNLARACRTQYQESDLAFIQRLLTDEGMNYVLETEDDTHGFAHAWRVFGADHDFGNEYDATLSVTPRPGELPLLHWAARRRLVPAYTCAVSHDYKDNAHHEGRGTGRRNLGMGDVARGSFGSYDTLSPRAISRPASDMRVPATHRQWAHDLDAEVFCGSTLAPLTLARPIRVCDLASGRRPAEGSRQPKGHEEGYLVTAQTLVASVAPPGEVRERWAALIAEVLDTTGVHLFASPADRAPLHCVFEAQPLGKPIVPPHPARTDRPRPGPMTATVVGPEGSVVSTDALGRIAVSFHWERSPDAPQFACNFPDFSQQPPVRVRYVHPGAGKSIGMQYLPRVGDEVLILFIDNDPDKPIAVGSVHNGQLTPPAFGGVSALPTDAALTGMRTGEHKGGGSSELVFDDTTGQVGAHLGTSTAGTDLNLGHIATPRQGGKAKKRGAGAELRTDGAAAIRAARGILVSTEVAARDAHLLHHNDLTELLARCEELTRTLARAVSRSGGADTSLDGQAAMKRSLATWTGAAPASDGKSGAPSGVLALHGRDGIVAGTPASHVTYAGKHVDVAADGDVNLVSGGLTHLTAGQGLTLHACGGGADLRAASGPVRIEASEHGVRVDARQAVALRSHDDEILLTGRTIRLVAGDGSFIKLGDGIEVGSPGACRIDVDKIDHDGPRRMERQVTSAKPTTTRQRAQIVFHDADPAQVLPVAGRAYKSSQGESTQFQGTTNQEGMTDWVEADTVTRGWVDADPTARSAEGDAE